MPKSASRGECLLPGGCLLWAVSAPGGVCSMGGCLLGGVSALGCVSAPGVWGCLLLGGVVYEQCTVPDTPPVNRMTNRCKNITLATTSFWPVNIQRLDQGLNPDHLFSCQAL